MATGDSTVSTIEEPEAAEVFPDSYFSDLQTQALEAQHLLSGIERLLIESAESGGGPDHTGSGLPWFGYLRRVVLVVFAAIFLAFPRQTLLALGVLVGVVALAIHLTMIKPWQDEKALLAKIKADLAYDVGACSRECLLLISMRNSSRSALDKISWEVEAYQPGYSTNLAPYGSGYSSDKILQPGERWRDCYTLPGDVAQRNDAASLRYSVHVTSAR